MKHCIMKTPTLKFSIFSEKFINLPRHFLNDKINSKIKKKKKKKGKKEKERKRNKENSDKRKQNIIAGQKVDFL